MRVCKNALVSTAPLLRSQQDGQALKLKLDAVRNKVSQVLHGAEPRHSREAKLVSENLTWQRSATVGVSTKLYCV